MFPCLQWGFAEVRDLATWTRPERQTLLLSRAWGCAAFAQFPVPRTVLTSENHSRPELEDIASELCLAGGVPAGLQGFGSLSSTKGERYQKKN